MSMRLSPKEPVMLRDTAGQDRVIDPTSAWKRHRTLLIVILAAVLGLGVLLMYLLRYAGAGVSVDRSRLSIAAVERGSFVRDIASDGQIVAAVSPRDRCWPSSTVPI
jgi:HlyD family secretion protein